jgi:hypothetical protein
MVHGPWSQELTRLAEFLLICIRVSTIFDFLSPRCLVFRNSSSVSLLYFFFLLFVPTVACHILRDRMRRLTAKDVAKRKKGDEPYTRLHALNRDCVPPESTCSLARPPLHIAASATRAAAATTRVAQRSGVSLMSNRNLSVTLRSWTD